jgi:transcriptional regulator with XRE-family HTH domain
MTPAEIVRKARLAAEMEQGELDDKLGCSLNTVSRWELGQREPSYDDLFAIAQATGHTLVLEITPAQSRPGKRSPRQQATPPARPARAVSTRSPTRARAAKGRRRARPEATG